MDITIQNASVQDMDRLLKMIDGMSDDPAMPSDDDGPSGCSICGGGDHDDHSHPHDHDGKVHDHPHDHSGDHDHEHDAPGPCGPADDAGMMRKHIGMLASAANDVEEGRHGNAPANTNDGGPDAKGDTHTDFSIRGATKKHHASTISGDNPLEDIKESEMFERYTSFTGRDISKKKDELDEAPPTQTPPGTSANVASQTAAGAAPAQSATQGATLPAPAPDPQVAQQAKQQQVAAQKAVGELATASKELQGHIKTMQTIAPGLGMDIAKDPEIQAMQQLAGNLDAKAKATAAAAKQIPDPAKVAQQAPAGPAPAVAAPAQATA